MKKTIVILVLLCILNSCLGRKQRENIEALTDAGTESGFANNAVTDEYLYIGGKRYEHKLSELGKIANFGIELHTDDMVPPSNSLEGIELLTNVNRLTIIQRNSWVDISGIDFSPLESLKHLRDLEIYYATFDEIPDFGGIPSLQWIYMDECRITSLNGIEKANQIKILTINFENYYSGSFTPLSALTELESLRIAGVPFASEEYERIVFRTADLSGMAGLKGLHIGHFRAVDLGGIRNLTNLKALSLDEHAHITNIHELAQLRNLEAINELPIPASITSPDLLAPLTNLTRIELNGSGQTLDIAPLKNLVNLKWVVLQNFTIVNFQVLDGLPELKHVATYGSKFYPESNNKLKNVWVQYEHER